MFNIAIVDDNKSFLYHMEEKLRKEMYSKYMPFYIQSYETAEQLIADLSEEKTYDLLFIDIRLDENRNGIDTAKQIIERLPEIQIVFITYYPQYYLDVYEVPHIYLITKDKVDALLPKALDTALKNYKNSGSDTLVIRTNYETHVIRRKNILYLEKKLRQIIAHTTEGNLTFYGSFKEIPAQLGERFVRPHKSYIVNVDHIEKIDRRFVVITDGSLIPLSRTYGNKLLDTLSGQMTEGEDE
ncbi:MAG: LytTR family DNA-binding domain-containing protein [Solobacterium sp.]|nr:LytTR family DNA-binding domain-containing protein [Solobacterium sp.]